MPDANLRSVLRLASLSAATVPVFVGFAVPYLVPGATGLATAIVLIATGAGPIWRVERRARAALDGDDLVGSNR